MLSTSPIPAPPAADEAAELADNTAEELVDIPPAPAPAEVPTLGPSTQAPVENPLVAEATEAAQAQAIPESLAEYGIEPVTDEVDAAQVEAPAFPLAPPPPADTSATLRSIPRTTPIPLP